MHFERNNMIKCLVKYPKMTQFLHLRISLLTYCQFHNILWTCELLCTRTKSLELEEALEILQANHSFSIKGNRKIRELAQSYMVIKWLCLNFNTNLMTHKIPISSYDKLMPNIITQTMPQDNSVFQEKKHTIKSSQWLLFI